MLVDTDAIRAFGAACSAQAADLSAVAAALTSMPGPDAAAMLGPVGTRFLAALADAATEASRAIAALSERLAAGCSTAQASAVAYENADHRSALRLALAMPSALIAALAAPIREVPSQVGPGWSDDRPAIRPPRSPRCGTRWPTCRRRPVGPDSGRANWFGAGADAAAEFAATTVAAADDLALRADHLGRAADSAAAAVAHANERLRAIVERFEDRAAALEPRLEYPAAAKELRAEAQRALDEAVAVVDELRAELDGHAAVFDRSDGGVLPRGDDASRPDEPADADAGLRLRRRPARR